MKLDDPVMASSTVNLKYGSLFITAGILVLVFATIQRGWAWFAIWPGVSLIAVGLGYLLFGAAIYGKRPTGVIPLARFVILAPFLIYTWFVWHIVRKLSREPAYHQLTPNLFIGRRLLPHELPPNVDCIVDLTSEFFEPPAIRNLPGYICFPMLDASVPSVAAFVSFLRELHHRAPHVIYIHCAQGHGRTGLLAASLLLHRGEIHNIDDALKALQTVRPLARLNQRQRRFLDALLPHLRTPQIEKQNGTLGNREADAGSLPSPLSEL